MRKTIGATGFGLILLILSIVVIPLLSTTYKPLAAEQSVTAEEALTIATEAMQTSTVIDECRNGL
ncbi:hypothetical protein JCM19046_659 [Bacillus sp. JCM 19046]|nr:hypothetical protein JCM19046_659 [Bacillus sp. JCM 19046]